MVQAPPAPAHVLADRQVDVETPEHVAIGYELADLGSRFTALLIDVLLVLLASMLFWAALLLFALATGLNEFMIGIGEGVYIFVSFVAFWGYMVLYEGLRDGQTIGKRRMGIRVVHDGGYPITVRASALRNLVKILVDVQPAGSCAIGGLSMMLHPQTKRLGDMAAGTVVVRDRTGQPIPEDRPSAPDAPSLGRPLLTDDEFAAVSMYAARRTSLDGSVRAELSRKLMSRVERHVADDPRRMQTSPDTYLCLLHGEETARRQAAGAGGRAGTAQATALVRRQRAEWDEYQGLLEQARKKGLDELGETRVSRFAQLYRGIAADLARARSYGGSHELLYSLERMVGAGHNLFYRPAERSWRRFGLFLSGGFAALARRLWKPIALASALFYLPALLTFAAIRAQPELAREIIPAHMIARAENAADKEARGEGYFDVPEVSMPMMASRLVSNNVQVTFTAFTGGMLAGIGTLIILVFNGLHLGSVSALFANHGQSLHLWTFIAGHGAIELTAICIAGGAGLWLGSAIVFPGRRTRREMLQRRGREAVSLLGGTSVMLLIAGFIEGFISTSSLPAAAKFVLAAIFALAMASYFAFAGRGEQHRAAAAAAAERE